MYQSSFVRRKVSGERRLVQTYVSEFELEWLRRLAGLGARDEFPAEGSKTKKPKSISRI